jgi:hypothetical protein
MLLANETQATIGVPESSENIIFQQAKEAAKYRLRYKLNKEPQPSYSEAALATRLAGMSQEAHGNRRVILNFDDSAWERLFLKKHTPVRAISLFMVFPRDANFVLLPFLYCGFNRKVGHQIQCTNEQLDALSKWVQPHLVSQVSIADIRKTYDKLVDHLDNTIMQPSLHWEFWKRARGLS